MLHSSTANLTDLLEQLVESRPPPSKAHDIYLKAAEVMGREWLKRSKIVGLSPTETASGYLKRSAYTLVRTYLMLELNQVIVRQVEKDGRVPRRGPTFDQNPFHWGFLSIFVDDSSISKDERRLFANQLLYAHRHDVPEHFLIGFIYQLGKSQKIFDYVRLGKLESWLHEEA
jgi:hypothetical protein